ncbi:polysaccharide biosynthesis tyrosine autokinase [Pistricoccus aurantiacus]|uniref:Polysaccharide biosynthesis tyrosine autokinase n=1 Tax=Pistricoccus aurantiacus TaxID=1883414 RepID=A0A5B8STT9_9GAMM|nr:polysaccharide biosynthesis tyrosine autokinase [Pistricoccus aurantiacus]QEA39731.1 polysaccharide biosynthesis tyrosine autokinase [Pistricoccus aurantiacus]
MLKDSEPKQDRTDDSDISFVRLVGLLLDHKWFILIFTLLFAVGGVIYALLAKPVYRADSLIQVESKKGAANPLEDVRTMLGEEPKSDAELGILKSRMVLGQAVDQERLDIQIIPNYLPIIGEFLVRNGYERPAFLADADSDFLRQSMWANEQISIGTFQVSQELLGKLLTIEVLDNNNYRIAREDVFSETGKVGEDETFYDGRIKLRIIEIQAKPGVVFNLVKTSQLAAINNLRKRFSVSEQGKESGLLNLMLNDTDPQRAQRTLNAIDQIYLNQNIQRQAAEAEKSLEFLEEQQPVIREKLSQAENELNKYRTDRDSVDLSLETQAILERLVSLESQLNELEFSEAEISRKFTKTHPTYSALLDKKQQLMRERDILNNQVKNLPETQQQVLRLSRDVEVNQQVYTQLLNKIQEMSIARASTVGNVRILDEAVVQPNPIKPRKMLLVVLAIMLGGLLSVAIVVLRSFFNRGVESPEHIESIGLPVYATVPLSEEQNKLVRYIKYKNERKGTNVAFGVLAETTPADISIEALRSLRTSLHFAMLEATDNRLVITGPSPGIGKSFISVNLSAVCAQVDRKVLLIDADMRKGHVHHAFGDRSDGGLSDLLSGRNSLEEVIRETSIEGLSYISRGMAPPNPSELLMTEAFTNLLKRVSAMFDLVIIDTPPVLAVTDPAIVANQCGTTLLVARFQLNSSKELKIASRRLETSGVVVKGCILNAMERKAATDYGYGYYNYSYKPS